MVSNIPVHLSVEFAGGSAWNGGDVSAHVAIAGGPGSRMQGQNLNWVTVFGREDPIGKPVFSATAPDSTTVPPGLDAYLTDDDLMSWASGAFVSGMPQGALFEMLDANGGGALLHRMEAMATQLACGVSANMADLLATVPGAEDPGFEFLEV